MHGLPDRPRLDPGIPQPFDQTIPRTSETRFIDPKATEPVGVESPGRLRHAGDARHFTKSVRVARRDSTPLFHTLLENLKLSPADSREHVAHPVVISELGVFVSDPRISRLRG